MNNYRIITLGTSGAGKTVFLASLFKQLSIQGDKGFFLEVDNYEKRKKINTIYTEIITGEKWPETTRKVTNLTFTCCVRNYHLDKQKICEFTYIDYAGALLTDIEGDEDISLDFQKQIPKADAVLAIIDGFKLYQFMEDQTLNNKDVSVWLLRDMPSIMQLVDQCKKETPVHFIISKWDLLEKFYKFSEILNRLLDKVPEFNNVICSRKKAGCPLRIIPISSIGKDFANLQPDGSMKKTPNAIPKPFQVEMPLICVLIDKLKADIRSLGLDKEDIQGSVPAQTKLFVSDNVLINKIKTYMQQSWGLDTKNIQASIHSQTNWGFLDTLIKLFFYREAEIILRDKKECLKEVINPETALKYLVDLFCYDIQEFEKNFPEANLGEDYPTSPVKSARTTLSKATLTRTLTGHKKVVRSLGFTSDSKIIFSASHDKSIRFWQLASGKLQGIVREASGFVLANLSKDNQLLYTTSKNNSIKVWNANTGKLLYKWKGHSDLINAFVVSADGHTLISGSRDKTVKVWQLGTNSSQLIHTLVGHQGFVYTLAVSPDWRIVASGSSDKTVFLWELDSGKLLHSLDKHPGFIRTLAFSPDGKTLVSGGYGQTIYVWDWKTRKLQHNLEGHTGAIMSLAISSDSRILASGSEDGKINLWDLSTGTLVTTITGHNCLVTTLAFSPDNQTLASGAEDNKINIWKLV